MAAALNLRPVLHFGLWAGDKYGGVTSHFRTKALKWKQSSCDVRWKQSCFHVVRSNRGKEEGALLPGLLAEGEGVPAETYGCRLWRSARLSPVGVRWLPQRSSADLKFIECWRLNFNFLVKSAGRETCKSSSITVCVCVWVCVSDAWPFINPWPEH